MTAAERANLRLLEAHALPVRTHEWRAPPERIAGGQRKKPIEVDGRTFRSVREALQAIGGSSKTLYKMLDTGRARYVE